MAGGSAADGNSGRPRLLLVPLLAADQWTIRPQLEEWADVASFDAPGVGDEPPAPLVSFDSLARRGIEELDRLGWERYVLVSDGFANSVGLRIAVARPEAVQALALGHARLSNDVEGERPPVNGEVVSAFGALLRQDYTRFVRFALVQMTHGSVGEELARELVERVPEDVAASVWRLVNEPDPIGELLARLDVPILFAKHADCLVSTEEGFEDACAAFPDAGAVSTSDAPSVSPEFARALREFCAGLATASGAAG